MNKHVADSNDWYIISNVNEIFSPALIVYPERIESNICRMIEVSGKAENLRPHVKTHKMTEIIKLQLKYGITKVKCATIAEAEMAAEAGAGDILLAYQPTGPNITRYFTLQKKYSLVKFSCIVDCEDVIKELSKISRSTHRETYVWLDINNGMNRTGIKPGNQALNLYKKITSLPWVKAEGLHVYDGHIHEHDLDARRKICNEAYAPVELLISEINQFTGNPVKVVAGGTPTFPIHAVRKSVETSPGTTLLWDYGYSSSFADLNFVHAAILLTRIVSKPEANVICIDLGHKAVGSEMPQPRIKIIGLENYRITGHNEEHMTIETTEADKLKTGEHLYAIPWHICPTVDRYDFVYVAENGKVTRKWNVSARKRIITI